MTDHDVLYGYRLQLFDLAARTSVSHACRTFGVHRSTYYAWKRQVDRHGLEMLRPRMPNQLSVLVEQRIVAFSLGHPGSGPDRISSELARPKWGGIIVSANGVWRVLSRHGLNTRTKRLALIAGYQPPRAPLAELHIDTRRPGELVGIDCFFVGRLRGAKHPVWQITAIDCHSSYAWADLVTCPTGQPTHTHTNDSPPAESPKTSQEPDGTRTRHHRQWQRISTQAPGGDVPPVQISSESSSATVRRRGSRPRQPVRVDVFVPPTLPPRVSGMPSTRRGRRRAESGADDVEGLSAIG